MILLMEGILHHLECIKPCNGWDKLPTATGEFTGFLNHQQYEEILDHWIMKSHPYYSIRKISIHPGKLTWNLKMNPWKRRFLLETIIFRLHVSFRGGPQRPKSLESNIRGLKMLKASGGKISKPFGTAGLFYGN